MGEPVSKVYSAGHLRKTYDFSGFRGLNLPPREAFVVRRSAKLEEVR